jgi:hypothetical protein
MCPQVIIQCNYALISDVVCDRSRRMIYRSPPPRLWRAASRPHPRTKEHQRMIEGHRSAKSTGSPHICGDPVVWTGPAKHTRHYFGLNLVSTWSQLGLNWSQPGLNLVSTWSQLGLNLISTGLNLVSTWSQLVPTRSQLGLNLVSTGPNLVSTWSQPGLNLVSTWSQLGLNPRLTTGLNLVSTWSQLGLNLVSTWSQLQNPGLNLVSTWSQLGLNLVSTAK